MPNRALTDEHVHRNPRDQILRPEGAGVSLIKRGDDGGRHEQLCRETVRLSFHQFVRDGRAEGDDIAVLYIVSVLEEVFIVGLRWRQVSIHQAMQRECLVGRILEPRSEVEHVMTDLVGD